MKQFRRCVGFLTAVMMTFVSAPALSSCNIREFFTEDNMPSGDYADDTVSNSGITNAEWLQMVDDAFGIQCEEGTDNIENAKELGLIKNGEEFDPDSQLDSKFAARTLMMAGGFVDADATDEEILKAAAEHGISISDSDLADPQNAVDSLGEAANQWSHRKFDFQENIVYNNVKDFSKTLSSDDIHVNGTEDVVVLPTEKAAELSKGSIFILPPFGSNKDGLAMKAVEISDNSDGTSTVKCVIAKLEEVYKDIEVSGKFSPVYDEIEVLDDNAAVSFGNSGITVQYPVKTVSGQDKQLLVCAEFSDIYLNADLDLDISHLYEPDINAYVSLDYDEAVSIKYNGENEELTDFNDEYHGLSDAEIADELSSDIFEAEHEIARIPFEVCPGIEIDFVISFTLDANGYVSFDMSFNHTKGFEIHNSRIQTISETFGGNSKVKALGDSKLLFSFDIQFEASLVKESLIKADIESSHNCDGRTSIYNDMVCIDVSAFPSASLSLEFHDAVKKLLTDTSLTRSLNGSGNKYNTEDFHCEIKNGIFNVVDKCSHGDNTVDSTYEAKVGRLELYKSYYSMPVGSSIRLEVKSLPANVNVNDLVWSSSDPAVLSIESGGKASALSEGLVMVTVKTSDGKEEFVCTVSVKENDD